MAGNTVKLAITTDLSQLKAGLAKSEAQLQGFGSNLKRIGTQIAGAFAFGAALSASFNELKEAEKVSAQTAAAIKSTGSAANVTADQVANLSSELSKKSGIDDELIQSGANLLLTFTKVRNEVGKGNDIFDRATQAALDLSVAGFGDLSTTSKQLGKALQDPITGMTALRRAGVTFTDSQKDTIRSLVETGDVLGAQKLILEEVERQVGGSAEAYGKTLPGQIDKARNALEETGASILGAVAPALELMAGLVAEAAEWFGALPEPVRNLAVAFGLLAAARSSETVMGIVEAVKNLPALFDSAAIKAYDLVGALGGLGTLAAGLAGAGILAGLVIVFKDMQEQAARADAATRGFAEALQDANPEAATLEATFNALAATDFDDILADTDANFRLLGDSIRTSGTELDEWERLISSGNWELFEESLAAAAAAGDPLARELTRLQEQFGLTDGEMRTLISSMDMANDAYDRAGREVTAQTALQEGLLGPTSELSDEQDEQAGALDALADAYKEATDKARDFFDLQNENLGNALEYEQAWDDLAEAIKENGSSLDITEQQGRDNIEALQDLAQAALDSAFAYREQTGDLEGSERMLRENIDAVIAHAREIGYDEDAVRDLLRQMGLTPEQIETQFKTPGLYEATVGTSNWYSQLMALDGRRIAVSIDVVANRVAAGDPIWSALFGRRAVGGPVQSGRSYLVGEQGPELITMGGKPGHVTPNNQIGGGGEQPIVNKIYIDGRMVAESMYRREKALR